MRDKKSLKLYCFSPPVMIATFLIEVLLAIWIAYRYRTERIVQLSVTLLILLAFFQLAEYNVCEGAFGLDSLAWSRLGYVAITFLPVIGIHMLSVIAKKKFNKGHLALYALGTIFSIYFLTIGHGLTASVCTGNYVIFEVNPHISNWYGLYYYGLELVALGVAYSYARRTSSKSIKRALYGLAAGYACLLVPTTTVNIINPETLRGIPSVMCGFAVILALIVVFFVLPPITKIRPR
jgi:hypothetical protein